jgi:hypothetical protein
MFARLRLCDRERLCVCARACASPLSFESLVGVNLILYFNPTRPILERNGLVVSCPLVRVPQVSFKSKYASPYRITRGIDSTAVRAVCMHRRSLELFGNIKKAYVESFCGRQDGGATKWRRMERFSTSVKDLIFRVGLPKCELSVLFGVNNSCPIAIL